MGFLVCIGDRDCINELTMVVRLSPAILGFFFLTVAIQHWSTTRNGQPVNRPVEFTNKIGNDFCKHDAGEVRTTVEHLSSGDYNQILQARNILLGTARQSSDCRQLVIRSLMKAMDQPDLDFERQPSSYFLWREGSQLLGELKATEALDLLISHLNLTNGFHSSSMTFQPAILGVRQMGQPALPKLALALQQNPSAGVRMAAVYCLTEIGGLSAMNALKQAQVGERSSCVNNYIKISLSTFTYESKTGISFDNQAPQANADARHGWLTAFECVE